MSALACPTNTAVTTHTAVTMSTQCRSTALAVEKRSDKLEKLAALQDKLDDCDTNLTTVEDEVVMEVGGAC